MGYYLDLSTISLQEYRDRLESCYLPPSRQLLRESREERFFEFESLGITDLKELHILLKMKGKIEELSASDCFDEEYLKILLREINSMHPKPNRLNEFSGIPNEVTERLEKAGIKNTVKLYDRVLTPELRQKLCSELLIKKEILLEITKLTDLSRIKWVGATFARILYDIGVDTAFAASMAEPLDLHKRINKIIKERNLYKGTVSLNDVKVFIQAAGDIPADIKF